AGVVGDLPVKICPSVARTASVKVPPTSTPRMAGAGSVSGTPIAASAGGLDSQPVARFKAAGGLRVQFGPRPGPLDVVAAGRARRSAVSARRRMTATFRQESELHRGRRFYLADDPVAAGVGSFSSGASPDRVLHRSQRELDLHRLD